MRTRIILALLLAALISQSAQARTKLATLPEREAVSVRFGDGGSALIEEERDLTLSQGVNQVDFSWRGVSVDPDSLRLAFLTHPGRVNLLSVAYPAGEEALVWRVASEGAWEERVRISYLLARIDRLIEYRGLASRDERTIDLSCYLILRNFSGETLLDASVGEGGKENFRGTSEDGQTRKVLAFEARAVPVTKLLTWDAAVQPWEPARLDQTPGVPLEYVIENVSASGLGRDALREGKARVYQDDAKGSSIFLGEDRAPLTPVNGKLRLRLGESRDVAVTQLKTVDRRVNPRPSRQVPVLHDTEESYAVSVENFRDSPVTLEVVEHAQGEWRMLKSSLPFEKKDAQTFLFRLELPAKGKVDFDYALTRLNLRN